jgi:hypothetical protein
MTTIHELKCWIEYYGIIADGDKTFEIRNNDRDFKVFDVLHLREYDPKKMEYTGNSLYAEVLYILSDFVGLQPGYVAMQIRILDETEEAELIEEELAKV